MHVLALNAGSSSLKFRYFRAAAGEPETLLAEGHIERIGEASSPFVLRFSPLYTPPGASPASASGSPAPQFPPLYKTRDVTAPDPAAAVTLVLDALLIEHADRLPPVESVGHRVVQGGTRYTAPVHVDAEVLAGIRALTPLAPLHNPAAADGIEACLRRLPGIPSVAVFDTAFHHTLPELAKRYALPADVTEPYRLQRFGFHGISYRYVTGGLLASLGRAAAGTRLILCHLGNGASACAVQDGRSVDTSMGLTPLEGLVMGTRAGDTDPGLLLYLLREGKMSVDALDDLLNHRSGLRGVSGIGEDVRDLEAAAERGDARAAFALSLFAYRVRKYIGAYAAAMGGLDAVAFTGGIGEHAAGMRARICDGLAFLGVTLSAERNTAAGDDAPLRLSPDGSPVSVWRIPTDEERQIARETAELLRGDGSDRA